MQDKDLYEAIMRNLIRNRFDRLTIKELPASKNLIAVARHYGFNDLADEMQSDLDFELKCLLS